MRILFVCDTYYPHTNGVYYFVCRIAPLLQQRGHQVAVIAPSTTLSYSKKKIDNIDVYGVASLPVFYYPGFRIPVSFLLRARIKRILDTFKPDVIHLQDHFLIAKTVVKLTRGSQIPMIGTNHFMAENLTALIPLGRWKHKFETFIWSKFSSVFNQLLLVTTPTETAAQLIRPKLMVQVLVISSGIDLETFTPAGDCEKIRKKYAIPDKPILLFVGRLDPEKHIHEVLEAVAVAVTRIDFCLVIAGRGLERPALERLATRLNITDNVIFTGFVPDEDLPYLYQLSHCFIIASIAELLSLATLQAMASALPVIAVNAGALPELVHDKLNGYLFNPGDTHAIVQSIRAIFSQDDLQRRMSKKSLQYGAEHDIHSTVLSFEKIYQHVSARKNMYPVYSGAQYNGKLTAKK